MTLTPLLGRDQDLAHPQPATARPHAAVTLVGTPDIDKIRLSLVAAGEVQAAFADAVWMRLLSPVALPPRIADQVQLLTDGPRDLPKRRRTCGARSPGATSYWAPIRRRCSGDWACSRAAVPKPGVLQFGTVSLFHPQPLWETADIAVVPSLLA
jgi:hypothetical protein